jgi:hypothetical protein
MRTGKYIFMGSLEGLTGLSKKIGLPSKFCLCCKFGVSIFVLVVSYGIQTWFFPE